MLSRLVSKLGIEQAKAEYRWMLQKLEALGQSDRKWKLEQWIIDRAEKHKPLQYILGDQPFLGLDIKTRPPVLIPRWETEQWVEMLIKIIGDSKLSILEIGSGSGCISLALSKYCQNVNITAIDKSKRAIRLSRLNQCKLNIPRVCFLELDLHRMKELGSFDMIVSNPPYISPNEYQSLDLDVKLWEDKSALVADMDGLEFYDFITQNANLNHSSNSEIPKIVFEIGYSQANQVSKILIENGFRTTVLKDFANKDRCILGY